MIQAIRDDDPVIFFEHKAMYDIEAEVPDEPYAIPFGEANVTREGQDVTIITLGRMVNFANEAADNLAKKGVEATVVDLRTTSPLDVETVLETSRETGRVVVVDEAHPRCSIATDIAALVGEQAFGSLKAPVKMVTSPHAPVPFSPALEDLYIPSVAKIEAAVREVSAIRAPGRPSGRNARRFRAGGERAGVAKARPHGRAQDESRRKSMPIEPIVMPKWGLAMEEGTLAKWTVAPGQTIEKGQEIADIETTKIANAFESPASGTIRRLVAPEGQTLSVGALLAVVADPSVPILKWTPSSRSFRPSSRRS